jgi:arylsulfatase A-like enzyme
MKLVWKCACFCLLSVFLFAADPAVKKMPDVFLVTIDTLRADHVHCYGYERIETPALDSLATDGIRFANAFTPSPITNTSHTTIFTGLQPSVHGVSDFGVPLSPLYPTWAELLHQKGYHTAAFIGAVILDSKTLAPGLDRGFDFYDNFPEHPTTKERWDRVERRGMEVVQHAETWLGTHRTGSHFVWIHLYDPHDPYEPPQPFATTYKDRLYDGEIAYADSALAHFLQYLKTQNEYRDALLIVVGDHGEGLGEHHEDTHGIFLYDATTHVPLIIKLPNARAAGKLVAAQVRTTDILPTVLDLLDAPRPPRLDGESLRPYTAGSETADRLVLGETDYPLRFGWAPLRSVRAEGFKFIEVPRAELYDLRSDPGELKNHYAADSTEVQKARTYLSDWKAKLPSSPSGTTNAASGASPLPDPKDKIEEQNLLHVAMLASDDGRESDARAALQKVLALDPASPIALAQLGELELAAGQYPKAAEYLKTACQIRPDDTTSLLHLGEALEKTGDLTGARDALESSLKLLSGQLSARILLGNIYLKLKDFPAAEDQFEAALLLEPSSEEAKAGLSRVNDSKTKAP